MKRTKNQRARRRLRLRRRAGSAAHQPAANLRELIKTTRQRAIQAGESIINAIRDEMNRGEHTYFETISEQYCYHADVVAMADAAMALLGQDHPAATAQQPEPPDILTFGISSWFFKDCADYLLSHSQGFELLHLVTGQKFGQVRTLERLIKVPLEAHSPVNAQANQQDLQKLLIELSGWGHSLYGLFHSHPGYGKGATQPSGVDLDTQKLYEQGGYPLVSAIFSRDGYVRFFSSNPVAITVFGTGVEQDDEHIFKIQTLNRHLPVQTPENKAGWTGVRQR